MTTREVSLQWLISVRRSTRYTEPLVVLLGIEIFLSHDAIRQKSGHKITATKQHLVPLEPTFCTAPESILQTCCDCYQSRIVKRKRCPVLNIQRVQHQQRKKRI